MGKQYAAIGKNSVAYEKSDFSYSIINAACKS
jgi:hypothetical protein